MFLSLAGFTLSVHITQNCKDGILDRCSSLHFTSFPLYSELNKYALMSRLQKWTAKLIVCPSPTWLGWAEVMDPSRPIDIVIHVQLSLSAYLSDAGD